MDFGWRVWVRKLNFWLIVVLTLVLKWGKLQYNRSTGTPLHTASKRPASAYASTTSELGRPLCTSRTYSVMLRVATLTIERPGGPIIREFQKSGLPKFFQSEPKSKRWKFKISSFDFPRSNWVLFLLISLLLLRQTLLKLMFCRMDHTKVVPLDAFLRNTSVEVESSARSDICCILHPL